MVWGFPKVGMPLWGAHDKDYGLFGSILGPRVHGNYILENQGVEPRTQGKL